MSKAKLLIDELIEKKAQGNQFQVYNITMKLLFKGIDTRKISEKTIDTPELLDSIYEVAADFNIKLSI